MAELKLAVEAMPITDNLCLEAKNPKDFGGGGEAGRQNKKQTEKLNMPEWRNW